MFDVNSFINSEQDGGLGNQTRMIGVDEGEYVMVFTTMEPATLNTKNGEKSQLIFTAEIQDNDGRAEAMTGLKKNTVRYTVWLDLDAQTKQLENGKNKNIWIGQMKECFGIPLGQPWKPSDFLNKPFYGTVKIRLDDKDASKEYREVKKIRAI